MDLNRLLDLVISRLRDQRLIFAFGGIVIVAGLAPFHLMAAMAILASVLVLVLVFRMWPVQSRRSSLHMEPVPQRIGVSIIAL